MNFYVYLSSGRGMQKAWADECVDSFGWKAEGKTCGYGRIILKWMLKK
jgi:hypothetical protein